MGESKRARVKVLNEGKSYAVFVGDEQVSPYSYAPHLSMMATAFADGWNAALDTVPDEPELAPAPDAVAGLVEQAKQRAQVCSEDASTLEAPQVYRHFSAANAKLFQELAATLTALQQELAEATGLLRKIRAWGVPKFNSRIDAFLATAPADTPKG